MAMPLYTKVIKLDQDGFANPVQTTITVPGVETKNAAKLTGDVNGGGTVNIFDLVISAGSFGRTRAGIMGDVNGDGGVNIFDLVIVAGNFGKSAAAAAPATSASIQLTTEQKIHIGNAIACLSIIQYAHIRYNAPVEIFNCHTFIITCPIIIMIPCFLRILIRNI